MNFDKKSQMQIDAERKEAADLAASIIKMTSSIPPRIVNGAGVNLIRQYKAAATKAVSVAKAKTLNPPSCANSMQLSVPSTSEAAMGKKIEPQEGEVYMPKNEDARHNHRRIIGLVGDSVVYSTGGDRNYSCKRNSFLAWRGEKFQQAVA